jgi:hypothetical protein
VYACNCVLYTWLSLVRVAGVIAYSYAVTYWTSSGIIAAAPRLSPEDAGISALVLVLATLDLCNELYVNCAYACVVRWNT